MDNNKTVLGIDLGATNIRGALVQGGQLSEIISGTINRNGTMEQVLDRFYLFIDKLMTKNVEAIGIGLPGITHNGMVYDLINIPAWQEIPFDDLLEERYSVPVFTENDANCFAIGEHRFGKGMEVDSMVGLSIGTGLGSGLIINGKLYSGDTGIAGEIGMVPYLDKNYDYYASGQFFENVYQVNGEKIYNDAMAGDADAKKMYVELGTHIGHAIQTILYSVDISLIVVGGSVRNAYPFFSESMWTTIKTFGFKRTLGKLKIEVSELENSAILGAAAIAI